MTRRLAGSFTIDVVASPAWRRSLPRCAALARQATEAALTLTHARNPGLRNRELEVAIVLTGDAEIRKLNAGYRGKDKPTNVLSFPALGAGTPGKTALLGDVLVAHRTATREARAEAKLLKNHLLHLVIHGVLHLMGYDHERVSDADVMEKLEIGTLATLGVANPYAVPGAGRTKKPRR